MIDRTAKRLDQLGSVTRGKSRHRPRNDPALYGGRWPFFQTGDVKAAELYLHSHSQTYNDVGLAQSRLWPAGTLCITIAANIAETAILGVPGCFPDSVVGFIADPAQSDARFVKYYIETIKQGMQNASRGTTQDNLSVDKLLTFEFRVPSAQRQRDIASILSTYDDLIENNTRRIAILEEMARRIYEEWFVRFRFPGHEGVRMVESELGLVPEGWLVKAASSAMDINPSTKVPKDGLKPFLAMNSLSDGSMLIDTPGERDGNSGSKFQNGDTLFARITPCLENGKTGFVQFLPNDEAVAFGSTEFIVLRSRTLTPEFVYLLARSDAFRDNAIKSMSGASGRQRVREACFDTYLLANPDQQTLAKFAAVTRPMFQLVQKLARKNSNLRSTRDLLLPKLISGELDVSALPEPEAVAA
jgi:type I restriction enzyme, S subunit